MTVKACDTCPTYCTHFYSLIQSTLFSTLRIKVGTNGLSQASSTGSTTLDFSSCSHNSLSITDSSLLLICPGEHSCTKSSTLSLMIFLHSLSQCQRLVAWLAFVMILSFSSASTKEKMVVPCG